jgi:serine O-acetyltransferase
MILSLKDLRFYKSQDKKALGIKKGLSFLAHFSSLDMYRYEKTLRNAEYFHNKKMRLVSALIRVKLYFRGRKLSLCIPLNAFGPGLALVHQGINVNRNAKIGKNCRILTGAVIGTTSGEVEAPTLGNNVFVGAGAKIIGKVVVADDVCIGCNAVVTHDILTPGTTWAGVPAKQISCKNSHSSLSKELDLD